MRVAWNPVALSELEEAETYYSERKPGLGDDLVEAVDGAVQRVLADPERFDVVEENIRRCRVPRFPYDLYFDVVGDILRILVVKHHRRRPGYWRQRLQSDE